MRPFAYTAATTVPEALAALDRGARPLAGGTTLYDLMRLEVETPAAIVGIHRVAELTEIARNDRTQELVLGAGARMADAADHPAVRSACPALAESLWQAASPQLRNMATLGGNLLQRTRCGYFRGGSQYRCNKREPGSGCDAIGGVDTAHAVLGGSDACIATYPGDLAVVLIAFDAVVDVVGPHGTRTVPMAELHVGPGTEPQREHTLAPEELIRRIRVPLAPVMRASTYLKIRPRESYAFALASAAVGLTCDGTGTVLDCRIGLGGVATRPWRAADAERTLVGQPLTDDAARRAGELAFLGARPGRHNGFKIELGIRTVAEALRIAAGREAS
ncbi:xanthine dehydrogenase family protein subunit M [Dactylosporangium fulvum]|uniref:Xanthine dehydrogenase family protein subunit M n=1 Tax=Dactylosporangium fulvum TaxID=53359 RepID=A0ABY5W038_9ACTN|nr:xanthine dehydrogenase family protein subunit M [Dactylosporangium fulvum]UWP83423.1 xanthine dehydrogenase family protein subunit M [Dactylosporangium fulvum]